MRRDQRRLRLLLVLLTLTSLTLVTLDVRGSGSLGSARGVVRDVVGPIETAASSVWDPVRNAFSSVVHVGRDRKTAQRLTKDNAALQHQIDLLEEKHSVADQIASINQLAGLGKYNTVYARVVGYKDVTGFEWTLTIDAGSNDGLKVDQTVLNGDGLVGKIQSVSKYTSVVLMIIDATSTAGARLESDVGASDVGVINGQGQGTLLLTLLGTSKSIKVNDRVVTLGASSGSSYVPGVPIGFVTKIIPAPGGLTREALVKPYVNMTAIDMVGIEIGQPRVDPRNAVLPHPTPIPTVTVTEYPSFSPSSSPGAIITDTPTGTITPSSSPSVAPTPTVP